MQGLSLFFICAGLFQLTSAEDNEETFCYYTELGFDPDAETPPTESEIKKAYRQLSRQYHPDRQGGEVTEDMRLRYLRIQGANRVLGDAKLRKVYELMGHDGIKKYEEEKNRPDQGGFHPFFGRPASDRGPTTKLRLKVPLEKVYNGDFVTLKVAKNKICNRCKGSGAMSKDHFKPCKSCRGEGHVEEDVQFGPFVQRVRQPCSKCSGKGKIPSKPCPICHGKKVVKRDVPLEVNLERGLPEGHEITFELEGEEAPDTLPGDLLLTVHTAPHDVYERDGNDLKTTMHLTLMESLVGFRKILRHLDDRKVVVEHRGVTAPGTVRKIASEGMPMHHVPADRGVLHVKFEVDLPEHVTEQQRGALLDAFGNRPPPNSKPIPG